MNYLGNQPALKLKVKGKKRRKKKKERGKRLREGVRKFRAAQRRESGSTLLLPGF